MDTSAFPKVRIRFVGGVDDAAFRVSLDDTARLLARGQRYSIVLDATRAERPTAVQRKLQAEFVSANAATLKRLCVGGAFAIASPIVRGALQAILWVAPLPFEHVVFGTTQEAEAWVDARLRRERLL